MKNQEQNLFSLIINDIVQGVFIGTLVSVFAVVVSIFLIPFQIDFVLIFGVVTLLNVAKDVPEIINKIRGWWKEK